MISDRDKLLIKCALTLLKLDFVNSLLEPFKCVTSETLNSADNYERLQAIYEHTVLIIVSPDKSRVAIKCFV